MSDLFLGTADRLRMLLESLLAEILEHVQTESVVVLEITLGLRFDTVSSEIRVSVQAFEPHCRFRHGVLYQSQS